MVNWTEVAIYCNEGMRSAEEARVASECSDAPATAHQGAVCAYLNAAIICMQRARDAATCQAKQQSRLEIGGDTDV